MQIKENKQATWDSLIHKAQKGNQAAITELYNRTYSQGFSVALQMVKNEEDAMDILQNAYISAFKNLHTIREPEKFRNWFNCIVANKCRDFLRKHKEVMFSELAVEEDISYEETLESDLIEFSPEQSVDYSATKKLVNDILQALPQEQKLCILMYYYNELSVKEIAEALECTENTVKSRLNYARSKIKEEVKALEKKGTKLYNVAPIPFIVWMLRGNESEVEIKGVYFQLRSLIKKYALKTMLVKSVKIKIVACLLGTAIVGGGLALGVGLRQTEDKVSDKKVEETSKKTDVDIVDKEDAEQEGLGNEEDGLNEDLSGEEVKTEQKQESVQTNKSVAEQVQNTTLTVPQEQIEARRLQNQKYREQLTHTGEYDYIPASETMYQFGVVDINGDGIQELFVYTYDPTTETDNGPNFMLTIEEDYLVGGGKGYGVMHNVEYCVATKHFVQTAYYDDGTYSFTVCGFEGTAFYQEEIDLSEEKTRYSFSFYIDVDGKYYYGDRALEEYILSEEETVLVKEKLTEYLPTRTKVTAPYSVTQENLDKYLPIDDAGIIAQLTK